MKIAIVHNAYGKHSGEETVVAGQIDLLKKNGHSVCCFTRSSEEIPTMLFGQVRSFLSGIFNPFSRYAFRVFLKKERPDVIHVHNLYPLVSPSILPVAKQFDIPVVMTVHNYRLVCPNGLHYSHGKVCLKCEGGREYWCAFRNCEKNIIKSIGYAIRNWWARKRRYYLDNISGFACLTRFQKNSLIKAGFDEKKIMVVPNVVEEIGAQPINNEGEYIGFSGRLSYEKGVDVLAEVAHRNPDISFRAAGDFSAMTNFDDVVPDNFSLLGYCGADKLKKFYENARIIVLPSVCFEGFPMVLLEAMLYEKAIICSDIGGLADIVEDGVTGLLTKPGDIADLEEKIQSLWRQPDLCKKMGKAGREKVLNDFSSIRHYENLTRLYKEVISSCVK